MPVAIATDTEPIPGYRLIERLGRGGFGEVWKAEAPGGLLKAIKFVYGDLEEATENGKPALQELKALNRVKSIRHPYILSLERFEVIEGQLLIVMELADRNLFDRFRDCQRLGLPGIPRIELLDYMRETAEALDLMNTQFQLQHLDIKPQNLFLVFNHIKVADFGLAKDLDGMRATVTGGVTPLYAAPETFDGWVSRFCDQYSLAIVFQELLTGQRPFTGTNARQLIMQHVTGKPVVDPLPPHDRPIIERALAKAPQERFPSCMAMVDALRAATSAPHGPSTKPIDETPPPGSLSATVAPAAMSTNSVQFQRTGVRGGTAGPHPTLERSPAAPLPRLKGPAGNLRGSSRPALLGSTRTAPPERTGDGVLMPTLVVGVGQTGLYVLQRFHQALCERVDQPARLPHCRSIFIDTDPDAIQAALSHPGVPLTSNDVILAKLNRPGHYSRDRDSMPEIDDWISPQLLFRIPRNPSTTGIRAFGRLALIDHYRPISAKLRAEIDNILKPEAIAESDQRCRLGLRTNRPRVYLVGSLTGGTGSGMILDLAYIVRQYLRQLGYLQPDVNGLLYVPPMSRNGNASAGIASCYAALTELLHFSSPQTTYETQFDTREAPILDPEKPFQRTLLFMMPKLGSSRGPKATAGQAAGYLYGQLFSSLGRATDQADGPTAGRASGSIFRTVGSYFIRWPRTRLAERVARRLAATALQRWLNKDASTIRDAVGQSLDDLWATQGFDIDNLELQVAEQIRGAFKTDPRDLVEQLLEPLAATGNPPQFNVDAACDALECIVGLVGKPARENEPDIEGSLVDRVNDALKKLTKSLEEKIASRTMSFIEKPALRLAAAEEFLRLLTDRVRAVIHQAESRIQQIRRETAITHIRLYQLIRSLPEAATGGRRGGPYADVIANIRRFAELRIEGIQLNAVANLYRSIINQHPDLMRDLNFCRSRLEGIRDWLERAVSYIGEADIGPCLIPLSAGCKTLDEEADRHNTELDSNAVDWETGLQEQIQLRFKGLSRVCLETNDRSNDLTDLVLEYSRHIVDARLGRANAAEAFFRSRQNDQMVSRDIHGAFDDALPEFAGKRLTPEHHRCVLLVPGDPSGEQFDQVVRELLPELRFTPAAGGDEIVFHREYYPVVPDDIPQIGSGARDVFIHVCNLDQSSPHARNDVQWLPLPGQSNN